MNKKIKPTAREVANSLNVDYMLKHDSEFLQFWKFCPKGMQADLRDFYNRETYEFEADKKKYMAQISDTSALFNLTFKQYAWYEKLYFDYTPRWVMSILDKEEKWYAGFVDIWEDYTARVERMIYRFKYGFSPYDVWNLDSSISDFVMPRLIEFKKTQEEGVAIHHPSINHVEYKKWQDENPTKNLNDAPDDVFLTREEWLEILDTMLFSFSTQWSEQGYIVLPKHNSEFYEIQNRYNEMGKKYFAEYSGSLWV